MRRFPPPHRDDWTVLLANLMIQTASLSDASALMEDQTVHVVCEVAERQFGLGPSDPDGADEQAEAAFLVSEDVLVPGANG